MGTFDTIFQSLGRMGQLAIQGAAAGLDDGAAALERTAQARARAVIRGQTGATFAGIVAYVTGEGISASGRLSEAVEAVRDHNPAHVELSQVGSLGAHELAVVLTVPTDYQRLLETGVAGDKGFLGPSLDAEADNLTRAAAAGIARVLR